MNEGHPLDWYPEDEPESRSIEEAEAWVDSVLTRREEAENMVKLHEARQALATPDGLYTTTPAKEIVMPSQRTTRRRQYAVEPRVYFMRCFKCKLVKIGFSADYRMRRQELQRTTGHHLQVLGIHVGGRLEEQRVHGMFRADRVDGEWFRYSTGIMQYIEERTTLAYGTPRFSRWRP